MPGQMVARCRQSPSPQSVGLSPACKRQKTSSGTPIRTRIDFGTPTRTGGANESSLLPAVKSRKALFDTPVTSKENRGTRLNSSPLLHRSNVNPFCSINDLSKEEDLTFASSFLTLASGGTTPERLQSPMDLDLSQLDSRRKGNSNLFSACESPVTPHTTARKARHVHESSLTGNVEEEALSPTDLCHQLKRTCSLSSELMSNTELIDEDEEEEKGRPFIRSHASASPLPSGTSPVPASAAKLCRSVIRPSGSTRKRSSRSRFRDEFEEHGVLGGGTFGTVYKCKNRLDGCMYAVKVTKQQFRGKADRERVLKEVFALSAICNEEDNPHIVRYFSAFIEDGRLYIQTELCDNSLEYMIQAQTFPNGLEATAKTLARHVLEGLRSLHQHNVVHLDIKPANIFVKNGVFKIGDLGHACLARMSTEPENKLVCGDQQKQFHFKQDAFLPSPPSVERDRKESPSVLSLGSTDNHATESFAEHIEEGDSRYVACEILAEDYNNLAKGDIFSLGASLYEMCLGKGCELPANGPKWHDIRNGVLESDSLSKLTPAMQDLIKLMLLKDPVARPSAEALLKSGGPEGVLRSEWEARLERERAAAEEYRKELLRIKTAQEESHHMRLTAAPPSAAEGDQPLDTRYRMRRSNTL